MDILWYSLREIPLSDHLLFPSLVALTSFHLHCLLFTCYDYFVLKREGIPKMIYDCALPQFVTHLVLNAISFSVINTRIELPKRAPKLDEFLFDLSCCYIIGDFFIYWEHVIMHRIPFLRHRIHSTHHKYTSPLHSFNAGWVHPIEIFIAAVCELCFPLLFNVHPLTLWIFLWTWVFWLVEEHSGDEVWFSLANLIPYVGGGSRPHALHHAPYLTKNFGFVFSCWDRLFGTYEEPKERKL